jgi:molybdopterin synthase catalytic subunit
VTVALTRSPLLLEDWQPPEPDPTCGAVLTFYGVVRNHHEGKAVDRIDYHGYEPMAHLELERIRDEVLEDSGIKGLVIVHRLGVVPVGEASLLVVAWDHHRAPVLSAVGRVIDEIKRRVPIWKKEYGPDGSKWVTGITPLLPEKGHDSHPGQADRPMESL